MLKAGDYAVIVRGQQKPDPDFDVADDDDPDQYHYLLVGTVVQIVSHQTDPRSRKWWGALYTAAPVAGSPECWVNNHHAPDDTQFVYDIHLGPATIDLSPTSVENYLTGPTTELVGGLIKTSMTPSNNPLNGNEQQTQKG